MQEDKEALFDTFDTVELCLMVMSRLLEKLSFNAERMLKAAQEGYLVATDLADYLVRKGLTFRRAHELVGKMVLFAIDKKKGTEPTDPDGHETLFQSYRERCI